MASWTFPPSNGGEDRGIHDAGIETFKGDLEWFLAREVIQNSVDARRYPKRPVKVLFEQSNTPCADLPGMVELMETFERCVAFWPSEADVKKFFVAAKDLARTGTVNVLRVSDNNTTGVPGSDKDKGQGWYKLVQCTGASGKDTGSGGSFGIGKSAPFAATGMRTVFYSTMTEDGNIAFRGVARLVSHEGESGTSQPVGYFGGQGGQSIRQKNQVPKTFRRTEPGTTLFILGYEGDAGWREQLLQSVLENFWPAILEGSLEVTIDDTVVSDSTLPGLLNEYAERKGFHAHQYYRAFTSPTAVETYNLPILGEVSVYLLAGDDLPSRVAMVRKTGMVIYHRRFPSPTPYCGVFVCQNQDGNQRLRSMEPPSHDKWDADRPDKNANRPALDELSRYVRDCVRALTPATTARVLTIPELNQFLPDDGDTPEDQFDGPAANRPGRNESFTRLPVVTRKPTRPPPPPPGDERAVTPIRDRAFAVDPKGEVYALIVQPRARVKRPVLLTVSAVGDDAEASPVHMTSARLANGRELPMPRLGQLGPVKLPATGALRVEVTLVAPRRLALRVTAHEEVSE